jgi:hypothetical protein
MPISRTGARQLFVAALSHPDGERSAFVAMACGDDRALRAEVESLLAAHIDRQSDGAPPSSRPPEEPFAPGDLFAGRYRMVTRLGQGAAGEVWRADDLVLGTPVAIKVTRPASAEAQRSLVDEIRIARRITHPGARRVFDIGEDDDGRLFLSMDRLNSDTGRSPRPARSAVC